MGLSDVTPISSFRTATISSEDILASDLFHLYSLHLRCQWQLDYVTGCLSYFLCSSLFKPPDAVDDLVFYSCYLFIGTFRILSSSNACAIILKNKTQAKITLNSCGLTLHFQLMDDRNPCPSRPAFLPPAHGNDPIPLTDIDSPAVQRQ